LYIDTLTNDNLDIRYKNADTALAEIQKIKKAQEDL